MYKYMKYMDRLTEWTYGLWCSLPYSNSVHLVSRPWKRIALDPWNHGTEQSYQNCFMNSVTCV